MKIRTVLPAWLMRLGCASSLWGSMNHPREGSEMASPKDRLPFDGFTTNAGRTISFLIENLSANRFDTIATATTATSASQVDPDGTRWFAYSGTAALPFNSSQRKYWYETSPSGSQRRIRAIFRSNDGAGTGALASFAVDADACVGAQPSGLSALANCQSSRTPDAKVLAKCGRSSQVCCLATMLTRSTLPRVRYAERR